MRERISRSRGISIFFSRKEFYEISFFLRFFQYQEKGDERAMVSFMNRKLEFRSVCLLGVLLFAAAFGSCSTSEQMKNQDAQEMVIDQPLLENPVKIDTGYIAGTIIGDPGKEVHIFRGIPYAAPPVGELRWKPPQPVTPWEGIRETTKFRPWAAQRYPSPAVFEVATDADMSEDCLYLNVLTPAKLTTDRLPVMVWFHGGGLDILSGNQVRYNSPDLPQQGVVLVTISHRLGPFGFLSHPWLSAESPNKTSGNYGALDLIAALEWVQRNISAFGGDPGRVLIFGQSGGGRKVNFMMASPIVPKGLFHRAVCHSGSINSISKEEAEKNGLALSNALGVKTLEEFRTVPWRDIMAAAGKVRFSGQFVEDGWSLLEPITQSFTDGDQKDVPYMIGMVATEDEGHFKMPIDLLPKMKQHKSPVYAYVFKAVPAGWKNDGVTGWHAIDVAYVFATLEASFVNLKQAYFDAYPKPQGAKNVDPGITEADRQLALNMKKIWTRFATTGNPSIDGIVDWKPYQPDTDYYLEIDLPLEVKTGLSKLTQGKKSE